MPDIDRILICSMCGDEHLDIESATIIVKMVPHQHTKPIAFALQSICYGCRSELCNLLAGTTEKDDAGEILWYPVKQPR